MTVVLPILPIFPNKAKSNFLIWKMVTGSLKLTHPLNKFRIEFTEFHWLEVLLDIVNNIGVF